MILSGPCLPQILLITLSGEMQLQALKNPLDASGMKACH